MYKEKHGVDPNLTIALDTKGPEIRTGLLEGVSTEYTGHSLNSSLVCISKCGKLFGRCLDRQGCLRVAITPGKGGEGGKELGDQ
jgi:hypothetical protein